MVDDPKAFWKGTDLTAEETEVDLKLGEINLGTWTSKSGKSWLQFGEILDHVHV